jgi:deoxyribodipyrimidine photo-lyase
MHNRLRMVTAMFLTKDLLIDWREGERFFMRHLIDGDLGANNGGWQWSASTGTDAQPYFRVFNPSSQSAKFDPDGRFIRHFVPELAPVSSAFLHAPEKIPAAVRAVTGYPECMVDHNVARVRAIDAFRNLA